MNTRIEPPYKNRMKLLVFARKEEVYHRAYLLSPSFWNTHLPCWINLPQSEIFTRVRAEVQLALSWTATPTAPFVVYRIKLSRFLSINKRISWPSSRSGFANRYAHEVDTRRFLGSYLLSIASLSRANQRIERRPSARLRFPLTSGRCWRTGKHLKFRA